MEKAQALIDSIASAVNGRGRVRLLKINHNKKINIKAE